LVLQALVVVGEVQVLLLEQAMVVLEQPVVVTEVVVEPVAEHQELELPELAVMALMVFLFLHTPLQVEHRSGSPTLTHNTQLQ